MFQCPFCNKPFLIEEICMESDFSSVDFICSCGNQTFIENRPKTVEEEKQLNQILTDLKNAYNKEITRLTALNYPDQTKQPTTLPTKE